MALSVGLKLSADAGNQLGFGVDNGLFAPPVWPRGGQVGVHIDNSWATPAAGTPYYYAIPGTASITSQYFNATTAWLWPFTFARRCRITALNMNVSAAGAGSVIYNSVFGVDPTGLPAGKLLDLSSTPGATAGVFGAATLDTTAVWEPHVPYIMCTWAYTTSAYPAISWRNPGLISPQRITTAPTSSAWFTGGGALSLQDVARTWGSLTAAPAALTPTPPAGNNPPGTSAFAPAYWFGLLNV